MKVIAFAASSSSTSINKQLVTYAVSYLADANVEILDLNDFELPLFSEDKEKAIGQPDNAKAFWPKLSKRMPWWSLSLSTMAHILRPIKTCLIGARGSIPKFIRIKP